MKAVILGGAECLGDDMKRLLEFGGWKGLVIVVNESGVFYSGRIDHWVTMHGEKLNWWRSFREGNGDYETAVLESCDGSSGGAAVLYAMSLGCTKVVLCGVPMDRRPHIRRGGEWSPAEIHQEWWTESIHVLKDHVRSMSGWTRETFGAPTAEWLEAP